MKASKTISTVGVGLAVVAGSMLAVNAVGAHPGGGSDEYRAERVTALAEKLGVEENAVESAFSELKEERKAELEAKRAEHIAGLVSDGILTLEQADELTDLKDRFKAELEALKDSGADREEIRAEMKENRDEIKAWAESEGIKLDDIRPDKGEGFGHKRGHSGFNHENGSETEAS